MKMSKYVLLIFLLNGLALQSQSLKNYRWNNRIIILSSSKTNDEAFQKQQKALAEKSGELKDRDLIILLLKNDSVEFADGTASQIDNAKLRNELKIDAAYEGLILIGKDGGVKMRETFPVKPQKIFDLIDAMPMRRAEMKN